MNLLEINYTKKYTIKKINNKDIERELYECGLSLDDEIYLLKTALFKDPIQIVCNNSTILSIGKLEAKEIEVQEVKISCIK